jgi:phospholipid/cholesterol/gamma-HCH transport system substrate-binding protein
MRRSVREAVVGFSLLAALAGGGLFWLWLRGVSVAARTWTVEARFDNASGLAPRSAVTYRGVVVGSVRTVDVGAESVRATLDLHDGDLRLPIPVVATVAAASLLGGESQVALVSRGKALPEGGPGPRAADCPSEVILCDGATVPGERAPSLETVTETMQRLLGQAEQEKLVPELVRSSRQFTATAEQAEVFLAEADQVAAQAEALIAELKASVAKADPALANLNEATARAASAAGHIDNLTAALDTPETVADLRQTLHNARELTAKIDAVGGQIDKLTSDPEFVTAVRSVTLGLGAFFEELYPARTAVGPPENYPPKPPDP